MTDSFSSKSPSKHRQLLPSKHRQLLDELDRLPQTKRARVDVEKERSRVSPSYIIFQRRVGDLDKFVKRIQESDAHRQSVDGLYTNIIR